MLYSIHFNVLSLYVYVDFQNRAQQSIYLCSTILIMGAHVSVQCCGSQGTGVFVEFGEREAELLVEQQIEKERSFEAFPKTFETFPKMLRCPQGRGKELFFVVRVRK